MDSSAPLPAQTRSTQRVHEHPLDVLRFVIDQTRANTSCALVMITGTDGGAVRDAGAVMAVAETGAKSGYLSGGCIDADIALNAQKAIKDNTPLALRYGRGSPFTDIKLPCGGGIDLAIIPRPDLDVIAKTIAHLEHREHANLGLADLITSSAQASALPNFTAHYRPKLALRIAGIGADPLALLELAEAAGIDAVLWSQDADCRTQAEAFAAHAPIALTTPRALPNMRDDAHTAFILMAHDPDWETPLLRQALAGSAFYIGAVGSPNTHRIRCETLRAAGVSDSDIARIHGPVGLVPSMRDASMLAISCLAEIVGHFHQKAAA